MAVKRVQSSKEVKKLHDFPFFFYCQQIPWKYQNWWVIDLITLFSCTHAGLVWLTLILRVSRVQQGFASSPSQQMEPASRCLDARALSRWHLKQKPFQRCLPPLHRATVVSGQDYFDYHLLLEKHRWNEGNVSRIGSLQPTATE